MNFYCSSTDIRLPYVDLTKHKSKNDWFIYLDKGWTKNENYFYKGFSSSWCKIYFDPIIRIESNKLRDFPIYHNNDSVSNFKKLDKIVPVDGVVEIDKKINVTYQENFYPRISTKQLSFKESHEILYDALIENVGTFASSNKKTVYIPEHSGSDTLTVRSVFDYLNVEYETVKISNHTPTLSKLGHILSMDFWGFTQIQEKKDSVVVTGFYGDEYVSRNPKFVNALLDQRGYNMFDEVDKIGNCYMKKYMNSYRGDMKDYTNISLEKLMSMICNDYQIWHLNSTSFLSPLKHPELIKLLGADNETVIGQLTNAELTKSIIEKCNPDLFKKMDKEKNHSDPKWFSNPEYLGSKHFEPLNT